ncbi:MAG TPA: prenyltransferase [Bacteroidales bacterium]|nr:prenyltransferase [Bacteroidales bacterium]
MVLLFFMIRTIRFWLHNARYIALPQSLLPALLAICMAMQTDSFSWQLAIIAFIGVAFVHLAANLTDDYFDYRKNKVLISQQNLPTVSPIRKGKCNYLITNSVTKKQLIKAILLLFLLGSICAGIIFAYRGIIILYFVLITGFFSISYAGFPFSLSYHGLGEIIIGFIFGPLLMLGVYFSASGSFSPAILIVSLIIGSLVCNILFSHSIMDIEADKSIRKRTLAVVLKKQSLMLAVAFLLSIFPYLILTYGIIKEYLNPYYGFVFCLLPFSILLFYLLFQYVLHPEKKYRKRFWMGPMEQWNAIEKAGIDQFMIRWYLARNICVYFCLIIAIISFL